MMNIVGRSQPSQRVGPQSKNFFHTLDLHAQTVQSVEQLPNLALRLRLRRLRLWLVNEFYCELWFIDEAELPEPRMFQHPIVLS